MKDQYPCKITAITHSKPGKCGHPKTYVKATDIFTNMKYEEMFLAHSTVPTPVLGGGELTAIDFDEADGRLVCMDANGEIIDYLLYLPTESHLCDVA